MLLGIKLRFSAKLLCIFVFKKSSTLSTVETNYRILNDSIMYIYGFPNSQILFPCLLACHDYAANVDIVRGWLERQQREAMQPGAMKLGFADAGAGDGQHLDRRRGLIIIIGHRSFLWFEKDLLGCCR